MKDIETKIMWHSTTEFLPPLDHHVLAFNGEEIQHAFIDRIKDNGEPFWTHYDYLEWHDVIYWAEFPIIPLYPLCP